jgi:hypothetical protein
MSVGLEDKRTWAVEARRRLKMRLQAAQEDVQKGAGSNGFLGYFAKPKAANYDDLVKDATAKKKLAAADDRVDTLYEQVESLVHRPQEQNRLAPFTVRYKDACAKTTTAVDGKESDMQAATTELETLEIDLTALKNELAPLAEAIEGVRDAYDAYNELANTIEAKVTVQRHRELLAKYRDKANEFYDAAQNCKGSEIAEHGRNLKGYVANLRELGKLADSKPPDLDAKKAMQVYREHEFDVEELLAEYSDVGPDAVHQKKTEEWKQILAAKAQSLPQLKAGAALLVKLHSFLEGEIPKAKQQKAAYDAVYNKAVEAYNDFVDVGPKDKTSEFDLRLSEYELAGEGRRDYAKTIVDLNKLVSEIQTATTANEDALSVYEADLEVLDEQIADLGKYAPPEVVNSWDQKIAAVKQTGKETLDYDAASDRATEIGDSLAVVVEQWKTKRQGWMANPLRTQVQAALNVLGSTKDGEPLANLLKVDLILADRLAQNGQYPQAQASLEALAARAEQQKLKVPLIAAAREKQAELQRKFNEAYSACNVRIEKYKAEVARKKAEFANKAWDETKLGKTCKTAWSKAMLAVPLIDARTTEAHFTEPFALLAGVNAELDKLFDSSGTPTDAMAGAVDGEIAADEEEAKLRPLIATWRNLRQEAGALLETLEDLGSAKLPDLQNEFATQETLARSGNYEQANNGLTAVLVKLRAEKTAVEEHANNERGLLTAKALELRTKIAAFDKQSPKDVVIGECYKAIDDELKPLEKQITSGRLETLQVLDKKLEELKGREANVATKAGDVKAALARFISDIKLPLQDASLAKQTPNRLLELQAEADKLEAIKLQLEPAKLIEKIDRLQPRITDAIKTAKDIALARTKIKEAAKIVDKEFAELGVKMDRVARERGAQLPRAKDYAQLKVDAERYKSTALASEDPAIVQFHQVQLEELAKQIHSAQALSDEFVDNQLAKMAEQRAEDIRAERAKKDFAEKLKDFFDSPEYQAAQAAAEESSDMSKIDLINRLRTDAENCSKTGDAAAARSRLKMMETVAQQAQNPAKGLTSDLNPLLANWQKALENLEADVKQLAKAIHDAGDKHPIDPRVLAAVKKFPDAIKPLLRPNKLDEDIGVLSREATQTDKLAARERSLIVVRRHLRYLTTDLLLRQFAENPFGKKVRLAAACNALRQLNLNLVKTS